MRSMLLVFVLMLALANISRAQCPGGCSPSGCSTVQGWSQPIYSVPNQPVYSSGYYQPSYSVPSYGRSYGQPVYSSSQPIYSGGTCSGGSCNTMRSYGPVRQFIHRR